MNIGEGLYNMFVIGAAAIFWIAVLKLLTAKYYIPGFSEIVALV
jgi:hypothetical protein